MSCPNCGNGSVGPRRCPNCGHRLAHDSARAAEIVRSARLGRALLPTVELANVIPMFGKAVEPMFTSTTNFVIARSVAMVEGECGRYVHVCAWCETREMMAAMAGLANVSHGICAGCAEAEKMEVRA